ncbi:hypothetical protein PQX77_017384 [Marasmius sp. AFHP31]|nr:hypothetical protein PQX77_017384 [Marasmius sp. AFHP31]
MFLVRWISFCAESIPKPSRELLDDLWNVDLAFPYFVDRDDSWQGLFEPLDSWVKTYHDHGINENEDKLGLMNRLTRKFRYLPGCFHLEWPSCVSLSEEMVYWVITRIIYLWALPGFGITQPSAGQRPRLTECDCDLSGGNGSGDTWHRAYQEACVQALKFLVSQFERLARSVKDNATTSELGETFLNLTDSSFLRHCCLDTELVTFYRTFLELAKECSALELHPSEEEGVHKGLLAWVETLPDTVAEGMKAQVLALPWAKWKQTYTSRHPHWKSLPFGRQTQGT